MSDNSPQQRPWYHEGLAFQCTGCGNCCTGGEGYVWVSEDELQQIAEYLDKPIGEIRLMHSRPVGQRVSLREFANGDCIYFDPQQRNCSIYPVRPIQCRTWPFWPAHLKSRQNWDELQQGCPGINKGDLVPLEVIEDRVQESDFLKRD